MCTGNTGGIEKAIGSKVESRSTNDDGLKYSTVIVCQNLQQKLRRNSPLDTYIAFCLSVGLFVCISASLSLLLYLSYCSTYQCCW